MYIINEWRQRYEVNDKGQPAKDGDKLRVRPLDYIRSKVHGKDQGAGFYKMQLKAKSRAYEVFGIFLKFLEIAGDAGPDDRGKLLNQQGNPATVLDLAHILRTTEAKITFSLQILTDTEVAWVLSDTFQENPEIPGIPGKSGALYNETKRNETEGNETERKAPGKSGTQESANPQPPETSSVLQSSSFSNSDRLDFDTKLRKIIPPQTDNDIRAIWNFEQWLFRQNNGMPKRALDIAHQCINGRKPIAVFFKRIQDDLGYRPQAEGKHVPA